MFYTIYQIINIVNGKIYIGKHQTNNLNDGYMGSGKHLKRSVAKYGIDNFKKEILFVFDNEDDMNLKESEIVNEEFVLREDTYNICVGGQGGFYHINTNKDLIQKRHLIRDSNLSWKAKTIANGTKNLISIDNRKKSVERLREMFPHGTSGFSGHTHTEETIVKMRKSKNVGHTNSQYGTMWITNGQENKKIKKDVDFIPEGWYKGRVKKEIYDRNASQ